MTAEIETEHLYWDVADPSCPLGYNPLTYVSLSSYGDANYSDGLHNPRLLDCVQIIQHEQLTPITATP